MLRGVVQWSAALAVLGLLALDTPVRAADSGWPRQFDSPSGSFVIYQPQPEDLDGDLLYSRAAFSLQKSADANPIFGVLWFNEHIEIDRDSSTVVGRELDVSKVRLPGITAAEAGRYEALVESEATQWDLPGSLEELKAGLAATEKERASVAGLDNTPPRIQFVYERAFLVPYDGAPMLEPIEGSSLEWVVNTPYAVILDPARHEYYLSGPDLWYRAKDPLGPWVVTASPPASVRAVMPPDTSSRDQVEGPPPRVFTATTPTELISIDGQPQYAPLVGDELLYVTNTESDVVRLVSTQALYVLLSGRWFTAATPDGPWTFVRGDQLPAVFAQVPLDSPKGNILASVAGTEQADDAVADAGIPQTSAIRRDGVDFQVTYDGPPQFEPIEGTSMQYAVNTDAEVIFADGRHYACDQGVWYIADSPDGPWQVSETRPIEVDDIPPSCPVYDVRYVYIYDVTPDYVYMGYLPGYLDCYPYYGTVVYGTGYRYRPWRGRHHYYPRPWTWGFHARYNPWMGRWGFGLTYNSGFLRIGYRWKRGPNLDHPQSRPRWFGAGGYRRPLLGADRSFLRSRRPGRPVGRSADLTPMNLYRRPTNVGRVDRTASRLPIRQIAPSPGRPPNRPNNVFAGRDGRVYQRDERGNWKVNEGRAWKPARITEKPRAKPVPVAPGSVGGSTSPRTRPEAPSPPKPQPRPQPVRPSEPRAPAARPPQPQPVRPSEPRAPAAPAQQPRPVAPEIRPEPGNLEREYRARQRSGAEPIRREVRQEEKPQPSEQPAERPAEQPAKEKGRPSRGRP
ncbi:MAG: hypothetical protein A2W00_09645 [Candidatus Eisenbacteria bacterium RBG_16_71_46]|nr:MAG: hypothetical protein A2W00_09645 [Candidatus Eisenbacteria bacterium RBG_16_71_46]